jgi:selenocysteine lyase/cysteine desulfurase
MSSLASFRESLKSPSLIADLRTGLIGDEQPFETPFGTRTLLYADYVASGRALRQVESFVMENVLPYYANSHTEASYCGSTMTRMRSEARAVISEHVNADDECHTIFTGSGATSGLNRIVRLLDIPRRISNGQHVRVLTGPYEHHSNILPWRESGAEIVQVDADAEGAIDLSSLDDALGSQTNGELLIGAFSAGSNVTGILTDVDGINRRLKSAGALTVWDYAAVAPYIAIDMGRGELAKDAVVFSPHKFPGGPGASGVMIIRDTLCLSARPTAPGGGSVTFVSPWGHHYSQRIEAREEAGTPNIIGDIRAALSIIVKDAVGVDYIGRREAQLRRRALDHWRAIPELRLLGASSAVEALPIFSFQIHQQYGGLIHHQLFTRMLSDIYGIQARGGCACAGPYAHHLLDIDELGSSDLQMVLEGGEELAKPGWVRLNFSYLHSDTQAQRIIDAVIELARNASQWTPYYAVDRKNARFKVDPEHQIAAGKLG